jgi:hypothetical protein
MSTIDDIPIPILAQIINYLAIYWPKSLYRIRIISKQFNMALDWLFKGPLWPELISILKEEYQTQHISGLYILRAKYVGKLDESIDIRALISLKCPASFRPILPKANEIVENIIEFIWTGIFDYTEQIDQYIRYFIHWGDKEALEVLFATHMFQFGDEYRPIA